MLKDAAPKQSSTHSTGSTPASAELGHSPEQAQTIDNKHFGHIERAPYELGYLLQSLPAGSVFSSTELSDDETLMAQAAMDHADNYNESLMSGIETIGALLFLAGTNEQFRLEALQLSHAGELIKTLACQAQYLQEFNSNMRHKLDEVKASATATRVPHLKAAKVGGAA